MKPSSNMENKTPSDTYWTVQLVCKKLQAHRFLEPEYNHGQMPLTKEGSLWSLCSLAILGVTEILCGFRLVLERKAGIKMPESSRLEFAEKFSGNSCALSDAENNTSSPLNRGGITDLPLLRILLEIP